MDNDNEPSEEVMLMEAISKAEQAFTNYLSDAYLVDASHFSFRIEICHLDLSSSSKEPLSRIVYERPVL